jgi:hypothetical protein
MQVRQKRTCDLARCSYIWLLSVTSSISNAWKTINRMSLHSACTGRWELYHLLIFLAVLAVKMEGRPRLEYYIYVLPPVSTFLSGT